MFKSVCQWGMGALGCLLYAIVPSCLQAQETSFLPPVMGWSSWNTYRIHISEDLIKKQTDAMVAQGLQEVGYSYINIDDGFFDGRDGQGNLKIHPERFPNGLKVVADYIHSKGFKAGRTRMAWEWACTGTRRGMRTSSSTVAASTSSR